MAIPLLIVMFIDRSYYNDEDHQILIAKARGRPVERSGNGLRMDDPPVDFAGLAGSFGIYGEGRLRIQRRSAPHWSGQSVTSKNPRQRHWLMSSPMSDSC